jgi:hypothetical protein
VAIVRLIGSPPHRLYVSYYEEHIEHHCEGRGK